MDYGLPILQDPWELDRASIAFQSVKVTRVEVIAPISFKGDSRRWRTNPLNRQSQSHRTSHAPNKPDSSHFASFVPWIRQLPRTSRLASLGDGRG